MQSNRPVAAYFVININVETILTSKKTLSWLDNFSRVITLYTNKHVELKRNKQNQLKGQNSVENRCHSDENGERYLEECKL